MFMLLTAGVAVYFDEQSFWSYLVSALLTITVGYSLVYKGRHDFVLMKRQLFLLTTLCWVSICVFATLPFLLVIYAKAVDRDDMVNRLPVCNASWVSIKEAETVIEVEDLFEHVNQLPKQMIADLEALWGGSPVMASAPDSICQYCQARGVCRKGMWS